MLQSATISRLRAPLRQSKTAWRVALRNLDRLSLPRSNEGAFLCQSQANPRPRLVVFDLDPRSALDSAIRKTADGRRINPHDGGSVLKDCIHNCLGVS